MVCAWCGNPMPEQWQPYALNLLTGIRVDSKHTCTYRYDAEVHAGNLAESLNREHVENKLVRKPMVRVHDSTLSHGICPACARMELLWAVLERENEYGQRI